jgi:hypothetical protein
VTITAYGFDINQIGTSDYSRVATRQPTGTKTGLVVDIIVNNQHEEYNKVTGENYGYAKIKILPYDEGSGNIALNWIPPKDLNILQLPLIGEEVVVEFLGDGLVYSRPFNRQHSIGSNISPITTAAFSYDPNKQNTPETDAELELAGVRRIDDSLPTKSSKFIPRVQPVSPEEGDLIIQGRFGNVIRFGSSRFIDGNSYPSPNILLSVGISSDLSTPTSTGTETTPQSLVYEDVVTNAASIWLVTDQLVPFQPATLRTQASNKAHLRDSQITRGKYYYQGPQVFIDSDRVVINSKKSEVQLFAKSEINLSALETITIASERSVSISSNVDIKLNALQESFIRAETNIGIVATKGDISINALNGNNVISGKRIFIGSAGDPTEPIVLGGSLSLFLQQLLAVLQLLPTVYVPQPSPTAVAAATQITTTLSQLFADVSRLQAASFNSTSNFTAKVNQSTEQNNL